MQEIAELFKALGNYLGQEEEGSSRLLNVLGQIDELQEFLGEVCLHGTVSSKSIGTKGRGPLVTHVRENLVPLKAPTDKHTSRDSDHGSSFNFKSAVVLGLYPFEKMKKRKCGVLTTSRPSKQKPDNCLIQKNYGLAEGSGLENLAEFLDPSMLSLPPPVVTSPDAEVEVEEVSGHSDQSLRIVEEAATEVKNAPDGVDAEDNQTLVCQELQVIPVEENPKELVTLSAVV